MVKQSTNREHAMKKSEPMPFRMKSEEKLIYNSKLKRRLYPGPYGNIMCNEFKLDDS